MSKTINLGAVTAYADAVAAGYTGTREQFAQDLANAATYAAESHANAEAASDAAETATAAASAASLDADAAHDDATTAHSDAEAALSFKAAAENAAGTATTKAGEAANSASQAATSASGAAGSATAASGSATAAAGSATNAAASETAAAGSATAAAGSASAAAQTLVDVNAAGATQIAAIAAKGEEVLESIPADYTELSQDVDDLKSDLNEYVLDLGSGIAPIVLDIVPNEYVRNSDGAFVSYNNWSRTGFVPVTQGKRFYYYNTVQCAYNCWYDANHEKIGNHFILYAGTYSDGTSRYIIPPEDAAYVAISNTTVAMNEFKMWYPSGIIDDSTIQTGRTYSSQKIESLVNNIPTVILPSELYVVEETQVCIYTDNLLLENYNDFTIVWQINNISWTYQYDDGFYIQPPTGSHGDYVIIFIIRDKKTGSQLYRKEIPLHVIEKTALTNKTVLFVGDSLTAAGYYPYEIQTNLSDGGIESVGTLVSHPYFNDVAVNVSTEGRGGWSAKDYVSYASKGTFTNAFWNASASKFDFSYYLTSNSISTPDIIFLNLGTNGVENASDEISAITEMITSIRAVSQTVPIIISLITPPATQNGWTSQTHGGSVDKFKRLQLNLVQAYIDEFDNKISNVYVAPVYLNLDRAHDFPWQMQAVSERNPYEIYRQTDNVHPSKYGYFKMADVYWGVIQHLLT